MKDIDENGVDRMERFRGYSQRFTQFSVADEVYRETLEYMKHLREQRDEARELYCVEAAQHSVCRRSVMDARTIARNRGWEGLFKEGGGA